MHRFSFILLFTVLPCIVRAQTNFIYFDAHWKQTTRDNASYYRTVQKQQNGLYFVKDHYLNEKVQMSGYYENPNIDQSGKTGEFTYYDSLGNIESEGEYFNNRRKGIWRFFYERSTGLRLEQDYTDDTNIIKYTFYDSITHKKVATGSTLKDDKDGVWKYYYPSNGNLQSFLFFKNGLKEGNAFIYDSLTGDIRVKCKFINDLRTGAWGYYNTSGNLYAIKNFKDDLLNGVSTAYDITTRKKISEVNYQEGKLNGKYCEYYPDGQPSVVLNYINNTLQGDQTLYYPNGNIKVVAYYINGRKASGRQNYIDGTPAPAFMPVGDINEVIKNNMRQHNMEDTFYFNKYNERSMPDSAYYYRVIFTKPIKNRYKMEERYIVGNALRLKASITNLDSLVFDGAFTAYDTSGYLVEERDYRVNHRIGVWKLYYPATDLLWTQTNYKDDTHAKFKSYFKNGNIKREAENIFDSTEDKVCYDSDGNKTAFTPFKSDPLPLFSMNDFLAKNLHYPSNARDMGIQGRVIVAFMVQKDGNISQMHVIKGIGGGCDEEAMRVLALMTKWKPGMIDDEPVDVYFTLPVSFRLE